MLDEGVDMAFGNTTVTPRVDVVGLDDTQIAPSSERVCVHVQNLGGLSHGHQPCFENVCIDNHLHPLSSVLDYF